MTSNRFATYIRINTDFSDIGEKSAVFDIAAASHNDISAAVEASGLSVNDMRSSAVVVANSDVDQTVLASAYTLLTALSGRWLDLIVDGKMFEVSALADSMRNRARAPRPTENDKMLSVGFIADEIPTVALGGSDIAALNAAMNRVQYAKDVMIAPAATAVALIATLATVAELRRRPGLERPGTFVSGDITVDLAAVRHLAMPLRKDATNTSVLAPAVDVTARQARLVAANSVDMEATLEVLGARRGPEHKQVWHCTRPTRHTNGDRVASMRIKDGLVRCMRCDGEPVGPLRLTADTLGVTPDEAAEYLLKRFS